MSLSSIDLKMWKKEWRHTRSPWGEKLDKNGYAKSLLGADEECYVCGNPASARHEIYYGNPNRKTSKACGFWVALCPYHHDHYHNKDDEKSLKKECQKKFEESHSREEFRELIGKNYL